MSQPIKVLSPIRLRDFNPDYHEGLDKEKTREKTLRLCERIGEFQELLYADASQSLLILLQGMDTSGKDGAVRHVLQCVNPAGVQTANFKAPSHEELAHDFLWRVHQAVPRYGDIGVFNRSHYEDVLVVRVHEIVPKSEWSKRYAQINDFERMLAENRVQILKFFLLISKKEQAARLAARLEDPTKKWKFSAEDTKERAYWNDYIAAYDDMLRKCSTDYAPWHVVPSDRKWFRNLAVAQVLRDELKAMKLQYPKPK